MPKFDKPDSPNIIWGVNALEEDLTRPGDSYIQTGWTQVKPPYEYENYSMNKLYQGFAYYNQLGLPEWDSSTEYQAGKSYVQASNNQIYKCIQTHTNRNPSTSGNTAFWRLFDSEILGDGTFSSEEFVGNMPFIQGGVKTNLKIQVTRFPTTGPMDSGTRTATYPEPFGTAIIGVFPVGRGSVEGEEFNVTVRSQSKTEVTFFLKRVSGAGDGNDPMDINYLAIGY